MRRIIVAGGTGFFGAAAVERLRADDFDPLVASRRGPLRLDVEDEASIRGVLRGGDVVVDCAGPFQRRTATLARLADELGFDLIDLSDSLDFCEEVLRLRPTRVRVLTACSSVSAVTAAMIVASGIAHPERVNAFLAPETRVTSRPGAALSFLSSVGRPIRALRGGSLIRDVGWRRVRRIDVPGFQPLECREVETADAVVLPLSWPGLRDVGFWVSTRRGWLDRAFGWAGEWGATRLMEVEWIQRIALGMSRRMGPAGSAYCVEVEGEGRVVRSSLVAKEGGYFTAVAPAVLAGEALSMGSFPRMGVIPPHAYVREGDLFAWLARVGVALFTVSR